MRIKRRPNWKPLDIKRGKGVTTTSADGCWLPPKAKATIGHLYDFRPGAALTISMSDDWAKAFRDHKFKATMDGNSITISTVPTCCRLRPEPGVLGREVTPLASWPDVPSSYIVCADDRTATPAWARQVARERLGVEPVEIPGGHCPRLSRPRQLADL